MDSSPEMSPYELMVRKNIEANRQVLRSLGLLNSASECKDSNVRKPRKASTPKRIPQKKFSQDAGHIVLPATRTRRSSSLLKSIGYNEFDQVSCCNNDEENTPPHKKARTICEPVFGEIEGISVGDSWATRLECSAALVHRPTVAGIHGKLGEGCYSLALSGGYEDDIDYGECFTYTGSGGRDLKGTKSHPKNLRTAPQSKDQILDGTNAALASNIESKKPVRVIRGYKLQSPFAPQEGYRYDGLYSVEKCWMATGLSGFIVCKFALKRLPNQDPPPWEIGMSDLGLENSQLQHLTETPMTSEEISSTTAIITPQKIIASPNKSLRSSSCKDQGKEKSQDQKSARNYENNKGTTIQQNGEFHDDISECTKNCSMIKDIKIEKFSPKTRVVKSPKTTPTIPKIVSSPVGILRPTEIGVSNANDHLQNGFHHFPESENGHKLKPNGLSDGNRESLECRAPVHITPVRSKRNVNLNHSVNGEQESKNCVMVISPCEKKVRFSPKVHYTDEEGNDTIESIESCSNDEENSVKTSRSTMQNTISDGKKQTSILNYFERVKKSEMHVPKPVVNPKSLRGNRFSAFTTICMQVETNQMSGTLCGSPDKNHHEESPLYNGVLPDKSKSVESTNRPFKSSSQKRKYSLDRNRENMFDANLLSRRGPSMMENLIKQNNEKLRLHHQTNSKKRKNTPSSPVKACFVNLLRLEDAFLGWDIEDSLFYGFTKKDETAAHERSKMCKDSFEKVKESKLLLKCAQPVASDDFHGWDSNKEDFRGASGLVPIGFMINKLSESKSFH